MIAGQPAMTNVIDIDISVRNHRRLDVWEANMSG
jgi:hypothetical protein